MSTKISDNEYNLRVTKIQDYIKKSDIDALLVTLGKNFQYTFGSKAKPTERLTLGIISVKAEKPRMICPAFEVTNIEKTTPVPKDLIFSWEETESPFILVKEVLTDLSLADSTIAISPQTPFTHFKKIEQELPKATFIDGYSAFRRVRMEKTETEVKLLQLANKATSNGIEATFSQLKEGLTEKDVSKIVSKEMSDRSGEASQFAAVQFGENSADPHGLPTNRKLKKGEVVLIDAGTSVEGYNGDITNTTFFGTPTKAFLEVYDIVEEAQQRAVDKSQEGVAPEDVDDAARSFIEAKGYGKYFTHRTGHGIGLDVHEDPYIVSKNKEPLLLHTTHSVEPGIYMNGKFGVRIEDIVIVNQGKSATRSADVKRRFWEK